MSDKSKLNLIHEETGSPPGYFPNKANLITVEAANEIIQHWYDKEFSVGYTCESFVKQFDWSCIAEEKQDNDTHRIIYKIESLKKEKPKCGSCSFYKAMRADELARKFGGTCKYCMECGEPIFRSKTRFK